MTHSTSRGGFTLVELLAGVVIFLLLLGLIIAGYRAFTVTRVLQMEGELVKNFLSLSRQRAIHGEKPKDCNPLNGYEVGLETVKRIYSQPICNGEADSGNKTVIDLENATLEGSGFPIRFSSLTGITNESSTLTLQYQGKTTRVTIDSSGLVQATGIIN